MNIYNDSLDVVFRMVSPEVLLKQIQNEDRFSHMKDAPDISSKHLGQKEFIRFAQQYRGGLSQEELENIYKLVESHMKPNKWYTDQGKVSLNEKSIFYLLTEFTGKHLRIEAEEPICVSERILDWRDISFRLGQDIFTTAHLALHDEIYFAKRTFFAWSPVIHNDDVRIRAMIKSGVAENHFHLGGSTRNFILSWICLMNHPEKIHLYFQQKKLAENLDSRLLLSAEDRQMSWEQRIQLACWIRVTLFRQLHLQHDTDSQFDEAEKNFFDFFSKLPELQRLVGVERFSRGKKFTQPIGAPVCLDYAISTEMAEHFDSRNYNANRIMIGERMFLYHCFKRCFSGKFSKKEQDYFYLYLLICSSFRGELIQINQRVGFHNFAEYQNRKTDFFEEFPEYCAEANRIAVNGTITDNAIRSLEARIVPKTSPSLQKNTLEYLDRDVIFAKRKKEKSLTSEQIRKKSRKLNHFYVLHFSKRKWKPEKYSVDELRAYPRNFEVRRKAKQQAMALAKLLSEDDYACERIRGIDACSNEIECRPETFATEFRFLREFEPVQRQQFFFKQKADKRPRLGATYHVGEDFLDITDGLRAIDEAVLFLSLRRGDRIGHALALGVSPEAHYKLKNNKIITTKQDRLDDIVWLIYRSQELKVDIPSSLRWKLIQEAENLLKQIYSELTGEGITLQDYFFSWKLRGNHPDLYRTVDDKNHNDDFLGYLSLDSQYNMNKRNMNVSDQEDLSWRKLLYSYHFGNQEQIRGSVITSVEINEEYIRLIRDMQDGMQNEILKCGIAIECNPSSNVLIGTFRKYENHPIFRFNRFELDECTVKNNFLSVSINTDDQGIFDTSLENEYALLASGMKSQLMPDRSRKYSDDTIYHYLNHVREMGIYQTFPSTNDPI